jgi:hypothetical protein
MTVHSFAWRRGLGAAAIAVAGLVAGVAGAAETRTFEKSFPAGDGALRLANLIGRVELVNGRGDAVRVEATAHAEGRDAAETRELLAGLGWVRDREGDGWAVAYPLERFDHYRRPDRPRFSGRTTTRYLGRRVTVTGDRSSPALWVDLRITYPARTPLVVRQVVGGVTGGDLYGDLTVDTGSGDVKLGAFNGDLSVDTGSGDIEVAAARGISHFDTGSGDVRVARVDAERLVADTGSGDVTVNDGRVAELIVDTGSGEVRVVDVEVETAEIDTGSGDVFVRSSLAGARSVRADTGSGDVEIVAGPAASFHVVADQGSGDLEVGFADARLERDGRKVVAARRGDGATRIEVDTGSGDARIVPGT